MTSSTLKTIAIAALTVVTVALAGFSGYLYTEVGNQDARADRAERRLADLREQYNIAREDLATAEGERDDAQSELATLAAEQIDATTGYHDETTLSKSIKSTFNKDYKKDDLSVRLDKVGCVTENEANTRFVCLIDASSGESWTSKVTVNEAGDHWIAREEK
jgi:hypothetical protein